MACSAIFTPTSGGDQWQAIGPEQPEFLRGRRAIAVLRHAHQQAAGGGVDRDVHARLALAAQVDAPPLYRRHLAQQLRDHERLHLRHLVRPHAHDLATGCGRHACVHGIDADAASRGAGRGKRGGREGGSEKATGA
jgi:hypothetical protein